MILFIVIGILLLGLLWFINNVLFPASQYSLVNPQYVQFCQNIFLSKTNLTIVAIIILIFLSGYLSVFKVSENAKISPAIGCLANTIGLATVIIMLIWQLNACGVF
jgi:hypothetical protein